MELTPIEKLLWDNFTENQARLDEALKRLRELKQVLTDLNEKFTLIPKI